MPSQNISRRQFLTLASVGLGSGLAACAQGPSVTPVPIPTLAVAAAATATPVPPTVQPDVPIAPFPAELPAAGAAATKQITLEVKDVNLEVAPGVVMRAWTFDGTLPGPALRVRQGDQVEFTLVNSGSIQHSIECLI